MNICSLETVPRESIEYAIVTLLCAWASLVMSSPPEQLRPQIGRDNQNQQHADSVPQNQFWVSRWYFPYHKAFSYSSDEKNFGSFDLEEQVCSSSGALTLKAAIKIKFPQIQLYLAWLHWISMPNWNRLSKRRSQIQILLKADIFTLIKPQSLQSQKDSKFTEGFGCRSSKS